MLRDREYVYAVYQERSFSRAAQRLFISQPALSSKVKKVEERVGAPLFDRSTNPIRLTPAGKCYVEAVEQVMGIEDELRSRLAQLADQREGAITIEHPPISAPMCCLSWRWNFSAGTPAMWSAGWKAIPAT